MSLLASMARRERLGQREMLHPSEVTEWTYFTQSGKAWDAVYAACETATSTIDFEQYIFRARYIGKEFLTLFRRKAREGVKIRLLCDTFGSGGLYLSPQRKTLRQHGIDLMFYNPPHIWKPDWSVFPRDHRKIAIIDRTVAFTGGVCIDEKMRFWRDTHVQLKGDVVAEIQRTFDSIWKNTAEGQCRASYKADTTPDQNTLYLNDPSCHAPRLREKLMERLQETKQRLWIATPYFVPAESFTKTVCGLVKKGVDVSIMTSAQSNIVSYCIGRSEAGQFLKFGARYLMYQPTMLHAKTLLIDDDFVAIGSFNVDNLSFYRNQEADIVSEDPAVVATLAGHFEHDAQSCHRFTYEDWKKRSLIERALVASMKPIRTLL